MAGNSNPESENLNNNVVSPIYWENIHTGLKRSPYDLIIELRNEVAVLQQQIATIEDRLKANMDNPSTLDTLSERRGQP